MKNVFSKMEKGFSNHCWTKIVIWEGWNLKKCEAGLVIVSVEWQKTEFEKNTCKPVSKGVGQKLIFQSATLKINNISIFSILCPLYPVGRF